MRASVKPDNPSSSFHNPVEEGKSSFLTVLLFPPGISGELKLIVSTDRGGLHQDFISCASSNLDIQGYRR